MCPRPYLYCFVFHYHCAYWCSSNQTNHLPVNEKPIKYPFTIELSEKINSPLIRFKGYYLSIRRLSFFFYTTIVYLSLLSPLYEIWNIITRDLSIFWSIDDSVQRFASLEMKTLLIEKCIPAFDVESPDCSLDTIIFAGNYLISIFFCTLCVVAVAGLSSSLYSYCY